MFQLVIFPNKPTEKRIEVTVTDADIADAIDYGRAERDDAPAKQRRDAAYHLVLEGRAGLDRDDEPPWVLAEDGEVFAANAAAAHVEFLTCG